MVLRHLVFDRWLIRVLCHLGLTLVMVVVIAYAIADLFRSPRNTVDKLWGSACIYFMSGIAFASVLYGILLIDPNAFGPGFDPSRDYGYIESLYLSFNSLVGLDTAYPDAIRLVRNTALLEGAWGQLYLVLLIGRVLAPQEAESGPSLSVLVEKSPQHLCRFILWSSQIHHQRGVAFSFTFVNFGAGRPRSEAERRSGGPGRG